LKLKAELLLDARANLGEGAIWDQENSLFYWVDVIEGVINRFNPNTNINESVCIGQKVGCVVPKKNGGLMLAIQNGFTKFDFDMNKLTLVGDPESHLPNNNFNDGKCDPKGRFWAGTMSLVGEKGTGGLYCLDTNGCIQKKYSSITCSNGMAWSHDYKTMYYIDTETQCIWTFDYDLESGHIDNQKDLLKVPEKLGYPDGMTIDAKGHLWVAMWNGSQVCEIHPQSGKILSSVEVNAPLVTSCAFGGDNLDELYITTARTTLSTETLQKFPKSGGLFKIKLGVTGVPAYSYGA